MAAVPRHQGVTFRIGSRAASSCLWTMATLGFLGITLSFRSMLCHVPETPHDFTELGLAHLKTSRPPVKPQKTGAASHRLLQRHTCQPCPQNQWCCWAGEMESTKLLITTQDKFTITSVVLKNRNRYVIGTVDCPSNSLFLHFFLNKTQTSLQPPTPCHAQHQYLSPYQASSSSSVVQGSKDCS